MASSKTLTPTNVTISIPAMTDAPDASVFSNCVDKEADAINTLNSKIKAGSVEITASANSYGSESINHAFNTSNYACVLSVEYGNGFTNASLAYRYKGDNSIAIGFYNSSNSSLTLKVDYVLVKY